MSAETAPSPFDLSTEKEYLFTGTQLAEVLGQVGGAVSGVFLREDPEKVMPSEAVGKAIADWVEKSPELLDPASEAAESLMGSALGEMAEALARVIEYDQPVGQSRAERALAVLRSYRDFVGAENLPGVIKTALARLEES